MDVPALVICGESDVISPPAEMRGIVADDGEWHDDIHPTGDGFGRLTERIADALLELLVDARSERGLRSAQGTKVLYDGATGTGELYDLEDDPGELHPLRAGWEPAMEALRRSLESAQRFRELLGARPSGAATVPDDVLRRLRELGYVGDGHGD